MRNKSKNNKSKDKKLDTICFIPEKYKEYLTDQSSIANFNNAESIDDQLFMIHKFSSHLNFDQNHCYLRILIYLFVNNSPRSAIKKSVYRILNNTKGRDENISQELSQQLLEFVERVNLENNSQQLNDCVVSINECFNNFLPGIAAVSMILKELYDYLIKCLMFFVDNSSKINSPIEKQEYYDYIHNTTRCLVSVTQQCENSSTIISNFVNIIAEYCVKIFNNDDISFDTKNNCGILLITSSNCSEKNGFKKIIKITFGEDVNKWGINFDKINNNLTIICIYVGVLNTIEFKKLYSEEKLLEESLIYKIIEKLLTISKLSADKPSVILGANRALLLISRLLTPLKNSDFLKILNNLLNHVWTQLDHYVDTIRHVSKSILINLIKLSDNRKQSDQKESLFFIIKSIFKLDLLKSYSYIALSVVSNEIGCKIILDTNSKLVENILQNFIKDTSLQSYVISCYETMMRQNLKECDEEKWFEIWVFPLIYQLESLNKDPNEISTCLQDLLMKCTNLKSKVLNILETNWNDTNLNIIKLNAILNCALIVRKLGITNDDNKSKWRGLLNYYYFEIAQHHCNDQVRLTSLALIAESHKTTEVFDVFEFNYVLTFLTYHINTHLPSTRQQILFLIKKILSRFSESYYATVRDFNKNHCAQIEKVKIYYENFILTLRENIFNNLFPNANFSRRIICLEILNFIEPILKEIKNVDELWNQAQVDSVILCLNDSYDSNKQLAIEILKKSPVTLLKLHDAENTKTFLNNFLMLSSSVKPANTQTAAYMFEAILFSPVLKQVLLDLMEIKKNIYSKEFLLLKFLLKSLTQEVEVAKKSLLKAAACSPMYGILFCIRHLIEKYIKSNDLSELYWKPLINEIIKNCFEISNIVGTVVNSSSPEGHLPMDQDSLAGVNDSNEDLIVTSQMLLVCSWRSIKEVSLLLGGITLNLKIVEENPQYGLITENQILKIGEHFTILLTETKHRGAFEQAYIGFSKLCTRLWKCKSEVLYQLPVTWLNDIKTAISGANKTQNTKLCATRRSAGVPFMIQAILTSELETNETFHFHKTMKTLLEFANNSDSNNIELRTHSMNILRALYRHTKLGEEISPYVSEGFIASIEGFTKNSWAERNSATLLFSSLMTRMFGVQRYKDTTKLSIRNKMTARVFFLRHPILHSFLIKKLKELTDSFCENHKLIALFPILLLLSRLYPTNYDKYESDNLLSDFIPFVCKCAYNNNLRIRELSGQALLSLIQTENRNLMIQNLFATLKINQSMIYIHGTLLQIFALLSAHGNNNYIYNYENILIFLNSTKWILEYNSQFSSLSAGIYMKIITYFLIKCEILQKDEKYLKDIMKILTKQEIIIENNFIIGKTVYFTESTSLFIHITYYLHKIDNSFKIYEFLLSKLIHKQQANVEFILNVLIYNLNFINTNSDFDISFLLNQFEIPQQEKNLAVLLGQSWQADIYDKFNNNIHQLLQIFNILIKNHERLHTKAYLFISYFQNAIYKTLKNNNINSYCNYLIRKLNNSDDDNLSSAIIICIGQFLNNLTSNQLKITNLNELFKILFEFSLPKYSIACRYAVANIIIYKNVKRICFSSEIISLNNVILVTKIIIQLLIDTEAIVRETIANFENKTYKLSPEKAKENLLLLFIETVKPISNEKCIALLTYWSLTNFEYIDEKFDIEAQIFEKGETSTYVEDMNINILASKQLKNNLNNQETDFKDNLLTVIQNLKNNSELFDNDINIYINLFEKLYKYILQDENIFNKTREFLQNLELDIVFKYKFFCIIKSLNPSNFNMELLL